MWRLDSEGAVAIVNECISFIDEVDRDKPSGEFFDNFHNENVALLQKLYKLKKYVKCKKGIL